MEVFHSLHFLRPWWLLAALPSFVVAGRALLSSRGSGPWKGAIAPHLLERLVVDRPGRRFLRPEFFVVPLSVVLAVALAGPAYRLADAPNGPDDTTIILVIDLSKSMQGRDIGPSRIGRVRLKLQDLIEVRRGSRIGLIAVAGTAHVVMPPTDDADALVPYIDVLDPDLMPTDGENFVAAAQAVRTLLPEGGVPTVVVVAADSLPPAGAEALASLSKEGMHLVGWAVGTKGGQPSQGVPGLDRAGFGRLEHAGAEVVDLNLGGGDVRAIDALLDRVRTTRVDPDDPALWVDSGYGLSFLFALGVLLWFRRGWVFGRLGPVALALLMTGCQGEAGSAIWSVWLTPDQQGRRLFERGDYLAAAKAFEDPMWKGISFYTAHEWKKAQEQFSLVDSTEGRFNLANAHAQAREIVSAIAAYDEVLQRMPTHQGARRNRDYFRTLLAGLEQTSDFDELKTPAPDAADPTRAELRPDQLEGPRDPAAEQATAKENKTSLSSAESEQWMKRVATNPRDFLRAKFSIIDQKKATP